MKAPHLYSIFRSHAYGIDLVGEGTLGLMLVTAAYKYSEAHSYRSDVDGEVEGDGYEAGGKALAGCKFVPTGEGTEKLVCDPVVWTRATFRKAAVGAILYHRRGEEAGADELLAYFDFARNPLRPSRAEGRAVAAIDFPDGLLALS